MAKYHLSYTGPSHMPETDQEMETLMKAWQNWFAKLGSSLIDSGAPFGASETIASDGSVTQGGPTNGYAVIEANNLDAATSLAKSCPVLALGPDNAVEVSEHIVM